ncbi:MAG: IS607 family transposase [Christensenellaceae bacterium]|jgi:predicted site-specific integrase-resolvase|nr:IS607 family transposase [Christensenellaceae bacterium]
MNYRIKEFADKIGVTTATIRRWDKENILHPSFRSVGNQRYYSESDLLKAQNFKPDLIKPKKTVIYCRVSNQAQKEDLKTQCDVMEAFALAKGYTINIIQEIGSGLNLIRPRFLEIVQGIINGDIGTLIVAHKDRLARFGFELVESICKIYGCELIAANAETLSPQSEMLDDLMSIIRAFSTRVQGLQKFKNVDDLIKGD